MRRYALIPLIGLAGCVTSPVYMPGLHPVAPLGPKGSVSASYAVKLNKGYESHVAGLVTDRWFLAGGVSRTDVSDLNTSHFTFSVGRVTGDTASQGQLSFGYSQGDAQSRFAGIWDFLEFEGAPYMAVGDYYRLHAQKTVTHMVRWLEFGMSTRLSVVKVSGYRRFAGTMHANKAVGGPYNRDTTFTGNLVGAFAEPSFFFGFNYMGLRVTPQISFALPLAPTAFGAYPGDIGVSVSLDSDFLKRLSK